MAEALSGCVGAQTGRLIFDAAPQSFDEQLVAPDIPAVHADGEAMQGEHTGERRARELRAFIIPRKAVSNSPAPDRLAEQLIGRKARSR